MSKIIDNNKKRILELKSLIKKIENVDNVDEVRNELSALIKSVPYDDVIAAEMELIEEGMPQDKMLELCDLHTSALKGLINNSNEKQVPSGHPVHTFKKENLAVKREISFANHLIKKIQELDDNEDAGELFIKLNSHFNALMDIDKHYLRKEYLLFPFLEKYNITGPPTVMWGKHDQIREMLNAAVEILKASHEITAGDGKAVIEFSLKKTLEMIEGMIYKEEEILFPMCLDTLTEQDWKVIYRQTDEYGYCLIEPDSPASFLDEDIEYNNNSEESSNKQLNLNKILLPTGSFNIDELSSLFSTLPVDITFVDKDDKVRFFSLGKERIFQRNKAILGRKVQFCHPPSSVDVVEKILNDFRTGKQDKASFWINMKARFIYISYFAVRNKNNQYLGTLEVTQDLTELRQLEGEKRILSYENQQEII